jgi:hypothetical protein
MVIKSGTGNVGIGNPNPLFKLDIIGRGPAIALGDAVTGKTSLIANSSGVLQFYPGGLLNGSAINIPASSNNVGISVPNPGRLLDVADRIRVRGGNSGTAGIFLEADERAFVGMADANQIGFWGNVGGWSLTMDKNTGTTAVKILKITGGADLAEHFEVTEPIQPGMVVAIDPEHAGKLTISRAAYNRRVAGVVSGANNLDAGMVLSGHAVEKDPMAVTLSGRVWTYCDAGTSAIEPGDLLTTSSTPGHAMKVKKYAKAQGAILGKALTGLRSGRGLVLVLATLQ